MCLPRPFSLKVLYSLMSYLSPISVYGSYSFSLSYLSSPSPLVKFLILLKNLNDLTESKGSLYMFNVGFRFQKEFEHIENRIAISFQLCSTISICLNSFTDHS